MKMRAYLFLPLLLCSASMMAQNTLKIHYKNGTKLDILISQIDSVTFVQKAEPGKEVSLADSWLWGSQDQGYYEVLTFNEDHTYTVYDNYITYGFDTMSYGWWGQIGTILTLQSNGFGYQRRYNWFITELTENALSVMTKMGPFTYYKIQSEIITLKANGTPLSCADGESFIFADGVIAALQDNKLIGLSAGVTYVQKYIATTNTILSYKIIVE